MKKVYEENLKNDVEMLEVNSAVTNEIIESDQNDEIHAK